MGFIDLRKVAIVWFINSYFFVLTTASISEIDDVFVRKDLYEGKYKPDLEKEAEFNQMMGDSCSMQTDMEQLEDYIQYITADKKFKIEL